MHIFDRLVERDAKAQPYPGLAESWRVVSDTVWEFKLRPGVKWHDGRDFTADDVAFTIQRTPNVPGSPGGFGGFVRAIERVEVVDPLTIRFHTARPHPLLPTELASVAVIARHAGEGAGTEDYNSGKAAIGTGPYRLVAYRPGDRTELARNEAYFRGAEPWARVNYRFIGNDGARTAALLAGDVDLIDQVPSTDLARLKREPSVSGLRDPGPAADLPGHGPFAAGRRALHQRQRRQAAAANPFDDLRVRRALSLVDQPRRRCPSG